MAHKRTYSRRGGNFPRANDFHRKRTKFDDGEDDELRLPEDPPRSRPQHSNLSTSTRIKFGGPVSFADEDGDIVDKEDPESTSIRSSLSAFDKALNGKLKSIKPKQPIIHGSRDEFMKTMSNPDRKKSSNAGAANKYLPTPPSDIESQQTKNFNTIVPGLVGRGSGVWGKTKSAIKPKQSTSIFKASEKAESTSFTKDVEHDAPKEPYVQKQYEADQVPAPRRDICGNRLSSKSKVAALWSTNQTNSPLLRLPGEVRNCIYDFAFGNKTIKIGYQTYGKGRPQYKKDTPVFKFYCTVINRKNNPFAQDASLDKWGRSNSFTLLSDVCRQLYLETSCLPFTSNFVAFESHNTMINFILHENRLSRQQRYAITILVLPDDVPGGNMLTYLPNVKKVWLAFEQFQKPRGWYQVVHEEGKKPKLTNPYDFVVEEL